MGDEMRLAFLLIGFLFFAVPSVAFAGWEKTNWGDSYSKTMSDLKGSAVPIPQSEIQTLNGITCRGIIRNFTKAGFTFDRVDLCFDMSDRLALVNMEGAGEQFDNLDSALRVIFGPPLKSKNGAIPTRIWGDKAKGNVIKLEYIDAIFLSYTPLKSGF